MSSHPVPLGPRGLPVSAQRRHAYQKYSGPATGARALGVFSIALGLAELLMPRLLSRAAGVRSSASMVRLCGVRELANGAALFTARNKAPWVWTRVAGDVMDIAAVTATARRLGAPRTATTLAGLAAITAADLACARALSRGPLQPVRDYGDRSGWPSGLEDARGAAADFEVPRDFATPEALRPRPVS